MRPGPDLSWIYIPRCRVLTPKAGEATSIPTPRHHAKTRWKSSVFRTRTDTTASVRQDSTRLFATRTLLNSLAGDDRKLAASHICSITRFLHAAKISISAGFRKWSFDNFMLYCHGMTSGIGFSQSEWLKLASFRH